ncbi:MAG TPA: hypothetical protein PKW50_06310 [Syntrophomonas sp.]|nr:hypothetical protein [Syntrophomonas sp.]
MEQKLKNQIAWLESLEKGAAEGLDIDILRAGIIEDRKYFQHERLIHLIVTMTVSMILIFVFYIFISLQNTLFGILFLLLLMLDIAYLIHYFRLENGVQKLWEMEQRILTRYQ